VQFSRNTHKTPWYSGGLAFECQGCGGCCAGPEEGYVWVTQDDIEAIAAHLRISLQEMMDKYARKVGKRMSLREVKKTKDCVFLETAQNGERKCSIYSYRPTQCLTWPFWQSNIGDQDDWLLAGTRCIGLNRGKLHTLDEIETRRDATRE
jgi:Fe-S-cluster containining protein